MARNENDMSGEAAATGGETAAMQRARQRTLEGDAPPSAQAIGDAVAKALARTSGVVDVVKPLGETVRASCRCGYNRDASPKSYTFKGSETADGREWTVKHGQPIRLKREAYYRLAADGVVQVAE